MSAATYTVPTVVVLLPLCVIVCLPVWFASRWVGQRIQARLLAKLEQVDAEAAEAYRRMEDGL